MFHTYVKYLAAAIFLIIIPAASVHATVVTETWLSTITSSSRLAPFVPGDTVQWTVTFDDTYHRCYIFSDGVDRIAQGGGAGDDGVQETWCSNHYTGSEICTKTVFGPPDPE